MNKLLYVVVCVDPRHKLRYVEFEFNQIYGEGDDMACKMIALSVVCYKSSLFIVSNIPKHKVLHLPKVSKLLKVLTLLVIPLMKLHPVLLLERGQEK